MGIFSKEYLTEIHAKNFLAKQYGIADEIVKQNYLNNMYVNQYSQSSVNKYNSQVQYVNDLI
jgi:hypothetical protein